MPANRFVPDWTNPIRIPDNVSVKRAVPDFAIAGETGSWQLPLQVDRDLTGASVLNLQLWGGRNSKKAFAEPQVHHPHSAGYVTARGPDGKELLMAAEKIDGTFSVGIPPGGLEAESVITVTLGGGEGAGKGIKTVPWRMLDKCFVLYRPEDEDDFPSIWNWENNHRIVAACTMHVLGGEVEQLRAYVPARTFPGEPFDLLVRPEDRFSNLSSCPLDRVEINGGTDAEVGSQMQVPDSTCLRVRVTLNQEGVVRLGVSDPESGHEAITNPTVCYPEYRGSNWYWGMIHGHTELSDGAGNIEYYFRQMKDEAALDFAAPADHDHVDETSDKMWQVSTDAVRRWHEPGNFVTFPGYEWSKWRRNGDGDRNVYYLHDDRPMYRSDKANYPHPRDLFTALQHEQALVIPHHPGHKGNWCDWQEHAPELERLVEIYQNRGSYECAAQEGNPLPEKPPEGMVASGLIRRALAMGWRVGFTAGGDDHVGHSGTEFPIDSGSGYKAGLMAVSATEKTREAIWDAMWHRRVVATSGPRIILNYWINDQTMGAEISSVTMPELQRKRTVEVQAHGTARLSAIEIICNNEVVYEHACGEWDESFCWTDERPLNQIWMPPAKYCPHHFCFYYVRLIQEDREMAWASPLWVHPQPDH